MSGAYKLADKLARTSRVKLVPLSEDHCVSFLEWISDKTVVKYSLSLFQKDRDIRWVKGYIRKINTTSTSFNRTIINIVDQKPIGYCGLSNISKTNNSAEYFILIGKKSNWNKGFGTEAGMEILREAFLQMSLNRVWLTVSEYNIGAIKSYEKMGFSKEGKMRQACFRDGKYHDKIVMSILREEWR